MVESVGGPNGVVVNDFYLVGNGHAFVWYGRGVKDFDCVGFFALLIKVEVLQVSDGLDNNDTTARNKDLVAKTISSSSEDVRRKEK